MIESYIFQVMVILLTTMLQPLAFVSAFGLLVVAELGWLTVYEATLYASSVLAFPSVTSANLIAYTTVGLEQGGGVVMAVLLILVVVPLCFYLFFVTKYPFCVDSRRLQQVTSAMLLVYGVVLCLAAVKLLSFAIPVSIISTAFIFVISFILLKRTRLPLVFVLAIGICIAILLL